MLQAKLVYKYQNYPKLEFMTASGDCKYSWMRLLANLTGQHLVPNVS